MKTDFNLIISNDQRVLNNENKQGENLYLGHWCIQNNSYENDKNIASPYGIEIEEKNIDLRIVRELEEELIIYIKGIFNTLHNINYSKRIWKIIIGHWLRRFISTSLNRYKTIKKCFENYNIKSVDIIKYKNDSVIMNSHLELVLNYNNNIFDNFIFGHFLEHFDHSIKINYIRDNSTRNELRNNIFDNKKVK